VLDNFVHTMRGRRLTILIGVVLIAFAFVVALPRLKRHTEIVTCSNQMHSVLFAATMLWPEEHNGHLPCDFVSMSNELSTPKILVCPGDRLRHAASNWSSLTTNTCSYEMTAPGVSKTETNRVFMRCIIYGTAGYADDRLLGESAP
jgi:hypothetical protein